MERNIEGIKPDFYSYKKQDEYDKEVFVRRYNVFTGINFWGAYSLHPDEEKAKEYETTSRGWQSHSRPEKAFVTRETFEKITKERVIFRAGKLR